MVWSWVPPNSATSEEDKRMAMVIPFPYRLPAEKNNNNNNNNKKKMKNNNNNKKKKKRDTMAKSPFTNTVRAGGHAQVALERSCSDLGNCAAFQLV